MGAAGVRPVGVFVMVLLSVAAATGAAADTDEASGATGSRWTQVVGSEFRVVGALATAEDTDPAVAYNWVRDEYLVVWQDGRDSVLRGTDIYGQRLDAAGNRLGGNFRISGPSATGHESNPAVAYSTLNNQYLVVWQDGRDSATRGDDIYGQLLDALGGRVGANFRISGGAAISNDYFPSVAFNATNSQYLVVWQDGRNLATRGWEIYGQRIGGTGGRLGANIRLSGVAATNDEGSPAVGYNPTDNQYLVAWRDGRNFALRGNDVYGQRVGNTGSRLGANFRISGPAAAANEDSPAVSFNPANSQYFVIWQDGRDAATRGTDIYGQRVGNTGSRLGFNFRITGGAATMHVSDPAIAFDTTASLFLVVWVDQRRFFARSGDIYGQRLNGTGHRMGANFRICGPAATDDEDSPAAVHDSATNQYLVVWDDGRDSASRGNDVYGRRVAG